MGQAYSYSISSKFGLSWKKQSNFSLTIRDRQKVGFLLKTLLKSLNPQFNHTTAALLLLPGSRENAPRAICCLFVHLQVNMPWLGESTHVTRRQAWVWEVASRSNEEEIPHSGRGSCRDSAKPICSFAELFTKMRGLGVAGLRFLLGSHFKSLLNFLTLHLCSLALVQGCRQSHPVDCCSQHTEFFESGCCCQGFPALFFSPCPDFKNSSRSSHLAWRCCFSRYIGPRRTFRALDYHFSKTQYC